MLMFRPESGSECRLQTKNFYFLIHSIYYFKLQHILCLLFNPGWRWILHLNFVGEILHGLFKSLLITRKVSRDCGVEQKKLLGHNLHLINTSIELCLICIVLLPCCHPETSAWSEHRIVTSQTPASSRWTSPGSPPASSDWSQCRELPCRTQDQSCTRHTPPGLSRTSSPWPGSPPWSCSRWCWRSWRRSWGKQGVVVHFWWDCVEPPRCRGTLAAALVTCEQDQRNILPVNSKKKIFDMVKRKILDKSVDLGLNHIEEVTTQSLRQSQDVCILPLCVSQWFYLFFKLWINCFTRLTKSLIQRLSWTFVSWYRPFLDVLQFVVPD